MSLFGRYISERENKQIIETDFGFITFKQVSPERLYIEDLYVVAEARRSGHAVELADKVSRLAAEKGIKILVGTVSVDANGTEESLRLLMKYGFKITSANNNIIFLEKEVL